MPCYGGSGVAGFRMNDHWQWSLEVGGCNFAKTLPNHWSGDSLIFHTGPQWILHNSGRWSPHMHFRVGGQKITQEYCSVPYKKPLGLQPGKTCTAEPDGRPLRDESTGFSISAGGGVDVKLNKALALRVGNVDYMKVKPPAVPTPGIAGGGKEKAIPSVNFASPWFRCCLMASYCSSGALRSAHSFRVIQ